MIHRVHRSHYGKQDLGSADVGRRLVAADVLLPRLHGHAERAALALVRLDRLACGGVVWFSRRRRASSPSDEVVGGLLFDFERS